MRQLPRCPKCKTSLMETAAGKRGRGALTELRCKTCEVLFYVERRLGQTGKEKR